MQITQVALVPLTRQGAAFNRRLLLVASALQTQIVRDFAPIWDVSAVVSPFLSLEEVPPQFSPVIVCGDALPGDHHGFHMAADGRPFALVHMDGEWSLTASHETLEMVLDPYGTRTATAPSLADEYKRVEAKHPGAAEFLGRAHLRHYKEQGTVDYLVEACDPCERSSYEVDRVLVSDFVTPHYYGSPALPLRRYSFLGAVTEPLQLLEGGYLCWRTREPRNSIWQANGPKVIKDPRSPITVCGTPADQLEINRARDLRGAGAAETPEDDSVPRLTRDRVDFTGKSRRNPPRGGASSTRPSWSEYGKAFRADVDQVITLLKQDPPAPTTRDIIGLFKAVNEGARATPSLLAKFNIPNDPEAIKALNRKRGKADLPLILRLLEQQDRVASLLGSDASDEDLGSWYRRLTY